jgi:hypothetical protein
MNLYSRDQYHFKGYDKGVMILISVMADKYSRNVLSVLYICKFPLFSTMYIFVYDK